MRFDALKSWKSSCFVTLATAMAPDACNSHDNGLLIFERSQVEIQGAASPDAALGVSGMAKVVFRIAICLPRNFRGDIQ